jgi:transcriptional regulator with XRE-family HTH domain
MVITHGDLVALRIHVSTIRCDSYVPREPTLTQGASEKIIYPTICHMPQLAGPVGSSQVRRWGELTDAQPNLHRRMLGLELRALRKESALSLAEAAARLGLSGPSALSKIENGKQRVPAISLPGFFEAYGVTGEARTTKIRAIAKLAASGRPGSLLAQYRDNLSDPFAEYIHLETLAKKAEVFTFFVPGLLQTEEYATAVVSSARAWDSKREIAKYVELRMLRQEQALAGPVPLQIWAIMDEGVLRRQVGGSQVMRAQLEKLAEAAEELPHVDLQVLTYDKGAHAGIDGGFILLHFEAGTPVAIVEPMTTSLYLEQDKDIGRYETAFDHLRTQALDTEQSVAFIRNMIKDQQT